MDKVVKGQLTQFLTPHWLTPNGACLMLSWEMKAIIATVKIDVFWRFGRFQRQFEKVFVIGG